MSENISENRYREIAIAIAELYIQENSDKVKSIKMAETLGITIPELVEVIRHAKEKNKKEIAPKAEEAPTYETAALTSFASQLFLGSPIVEGDAGVS